MEVSSSNLSFRISLVDIDALKPHEEVVDPIVGALADSMLTEGIARDPLIVEQEDHIILDGMHRFNSLRLLKCRFVPCCLVDYENPLIKVGAWFRLFVVGEAVSLAEKLLTKNKLNYSKHENEKGVGYNPSTVILTENLEFSLLETLDPIGRAKTAVLLERAMVNEGHSVDYLSEMVAVERIKSGDVNFVIPVPIFAKKQIREFGLRGLLLPHKVTRHVIPSRPLRIDAPLKLLKEPDISQAEADQRFGELLGGKRIERKPPGSIVDGRRYEEELLVFSS